MTGDAVTDNIAIGTTAAKDPMIAINLDILDVQSLGVKQAVSDGDGTCTLAKAAIYSTRSQTKYDRGYYWGGPAHRSVWHARRHKPQSASLSEFFTSLLSLSFARVAL